MGFFSKLGNTFKSIGSKIGKGISNIGIKTRNTLRDAGFNKNFGRDFKKGFGMVGKALQEPQKYIDKNDPTGGVLGFGASLALAPITGIGYLEQLAVDDKLQNKLASGDAKTIMDTTFSGISIIPVPGGGLLGEGARGASKGISSLSKAVGRKLGKGAIKAI
jgi:hypothetical protein